MIVTDNLFGDILTDLGGVVTGGVNCAASANPGTRSPARRCSGGPRHRPRHRHGQNKTNPIAAIISLQLVLDFLEGADARRCGRGQDNPERYTGSTTDIGDAVAICGQERLTTANENRGRNRRILSIPSPRTARTKPPCPSPPPARSWMNGELVPGVEARIHVLTTASTTAMGVFRGIRAYETP